MTVLSPLEIAAYARRAGFADDQLATMTAIALAESSGNAAAHNNNAATGDNSRGLWQINMLGGLGPERRQRFGLQSDDQLFDPGTNAVVAKGIADSQGLNAWSVHRSGAYQRFLPEAQGAVARLLGGEAPSLSAPGAVTAAGAAGAGAAGLQQLAQGILDGQFGGGTRAVASDPYARVAQAALEASPFSPVRATKAASPEYFAALARRPAAQAGDTQDLIAAAVQSLAPRAAIDTAGAQRAVQTPPVAGGGGVSLSEVGKALQGAGLRVRENSAFGGVGRHSPGSLHDKDLALDLTDRQDPGEKESSWRPRMAFLGQQMQQILGPSAEVFHPGNDSGHSSHVHLGVPSGSLSPAQVQAIVNARRESLQRYPLRWAG